MLVDKEREQLYRECNTETYINSAGRAMRLIHRPSGIVVDRDPAPSHFYSIRKMLEELHQRLQEMNNATSTTAQEN